MSFEPTKGALAFATLLKGSGVPFGLVHLVLDGVNLVKLAERLVHEVGHVVDHEVDEADELFDVVSVRCARSATQRSEAKAKKDLLGFVP